MADEAELCDHRLLGQETYHAPPPDVDEFLVALYQYSLHGGFVGLVSRQLYSGCVWTYTLVVAGLLLWCVDWAAIVALTDDADFGSAVDPSPLFGGTFSGTLYFLTSVALLTYRAVAAVRRWPRWKAIGQFWNDALTDLPPFHQWIDVVAALVRRQGDGRPLLVNIEELSPVDVAVRVLRHDNYLVALVHRGVLGSDLHYDAVLLWNLRRLLLDPMLGRGERAWELHFDAARLRQRCRWLGGLNLLAMPLTLVVFTVFFALRAAAHSAVGKAQWRSWSPTLRWQVREYNEYPDDAERRMRRAARAAQRLLDAYPESTSVRNAVSLVIFLAGSTVGTITAVAFRSEEVLGFLHLGGRNLLWWLAFWTAVLTLARWSMPATRSYHPPTVHSLRDALRSELGYAPWIVENDRQTMAALHTHFPLLPLVWLRSIKSVVSMPWLLRRWSLEADTIVQFLTDGTRRSDTAGDVWIDSLMLDRSSPKAARSMLSFQQTYHSIWDWGDEQI